MGLWVRKVVVFQHGFMGKEGGSLPTWVDFWEGEKETKKESKGQKKRSTALQIRSTAIF